MNDLISEARDLLNEVRYHKPKKVVNLTMLDKAIRKNAINGEYTIELYGMVLEIDFEPKFQAKKVLVAAGKDLAKQIGVRFSDDFAKDEPYGPDEHGVFEVGIVFNGDSLVLHPTTFDMSLAKTKKVTIDD